MYQCSQLWEEMGWPGKKVREPGSSAGLNSERNEMHEEPSEVLDFQSGKRKTITYTHVCICM